MEEIDKTIENIENIDHSLIEYLKSGAEPSNKELLNYMKQLDEDTALSRNTLREKSLMCGSYKSKYLCYLYAEKESLKRIKNLKARILKKEFANIKNQDSVLKMKSEDNIAKSNPNIVKLNALAEQVQTNINFLEQALNSITSFGFDIKNCIDIVKLERS